MVKWATAGVVLVGVISIAGCSSSSSPGASPTTAGLASSPPVSASAPAPSTSTSTSTPASSSASAPATGASAGTAANSKLLAITLQPADLPGGYTQTQFHTDPSAAADQAAVVRCVGGQNTDPDQTGQAHSPDYAAGTMSVSSEADSYRSQSDVNADTAIVHSPKISNCYQTLLRASLTASQPTAKINKVALKITPGSGGGPSNVIGTGTGAVTLSASGKTVTVYIDVAFITGPLIEAQVDTESIGKRIPASLQSRLVDKVATRAKTS